MKLVLVSLLLIITVSSSAEVQENEADFILKLLKGLYEERAVMKMAREVEERRRRGEEEQKQKLVPLQLGQLLKPQNRALFGRMPLKTYEIALLPTSDLFQAFVAEHKLGGDDAETIFKDNLMAQYHTGLNALYLSQELKDAKILLRVVITDIQIVPEDKWKSWDSLYTACQYQADLCTKPDASLFITLNDGVLHKEKIRFSAGRGVREGLCNEQLRCAIVAEEVSLGSANRRLAAHELGHVLGLIDQGRQLGSKASKLESQGYEVCPDTELKAIMAGTGYTWCSCSIHKLKDIVDKYLCLNDKAEPTKPGHLVNPQNLLGGMYPSRQDQCNLYLKPTDPDNWAIIYNAPSRKVDPCKYANNECIMKMPTKLNPYIHVRMDNAPLLDGTPCGNGQVCIDGTCTSFMPFPVATATGAVCTDCPATCPADWAEYRGHCYRMFSDATKISQQAAQQKCKEAEPASNLATINSPEVNCFIFNHFKSSHFWIGLYRSFFIFWNWMDGTPYPLPHYPCQICHYSNWAANHPRTDWSCASVGGTGEFDNWYSNNCDRTTHYLRRWLCDVKLA